MDQHTRTCRTSSEVLLVMYLYHVLATTGLEPSRRSFEGGTGGSPFWRKIFSTSNPCQSSGSFSDSGACFSKYRSPPALSELGKPTRRLITLITRSICRHRLDQSQRNRSLAEYVKDVPFHQIQWNCQTHRDEGVQATPQASFHPILNAVLVEVVMKSNSGKSDLKTCHIWRLFGRRGRRVYWFASCRKRNYAGFSQQYLGAGGIIS
jgi:hypothetical protein